ncbi:MAG: fructose-specific PTS transporter subunit EIIC [Microbacterium sp.]
MSQTITPELVSLDTPLGADKAAVIRALAARVAEQGRATDPEALFADAWAREQKDETGLPGGIAIPHAKSSAVVTPSLAFARLKPGVDFGASDGPADLVFLIAAPAGAAEAHLAVLSKLARSLMQDDFTAGLRAATSADEVVAIVRTAIGEGDAAPAVAPVTAGAAPTTAAVADGLSIEGRPARIVAVTACATGIAHTFMAADALTAAGKKAGIDLVVEPQGSSGYKALPSSAIDNADAVIFATDVDVREPGRFAGKPVIRSGVKRGIEQPDQMIREAVAAANDPSSARVSGTATAATATAATQLSWGARIQRILLTGVSYMIPFVAGGGLLIALGFLFFGDDYTAPSNAANVVVTNSLWDLPEGGLGLYLGSVAFTIGAASMGFLVSALAGYISFAIADRPGIAPGFVAGAVAVIMQAGFIGGIVGGLLAGVTAWWIGTWNVPRWLRGLMPVAIIPLLASIVASGLMVLFLGRPIATLMELLTVWLNDLAGTAGIVVVGVILGLMMCIDLGGPVNKVAYAFAVAGLASASPDNTTPYLIMAAVMAAGMVPPLAMALASTVLARNLFPPVERENGKAAWLLGAAFISEGAIPFAAADPLRVIPASLVGGAVTGGLSMVFAVQSLAPHGGIFVFFAIAPIWGFVVAIAAGTVVTALVVIALKRWVGRKELIEAEAPFEPVPVSA